MKLKLNDQAPDFSLFDQTNKLHKLSNYLGKYVLLYFYPRDNTPGCTLEACNLRDNWSEFDNLNVVVLGISTDSIESHTKFADKLQLLFPILADDDKKVVQLYGVWGEKKFIGRTYMGTNRMSFLIDPEGNIVKIYEKVKPAQHAREVLHDLQKLLPNNIVNISQ